MRVFWFVVGAVGLFFLFIYWLGTLSQSEFDSHFPAVKELMDQHG
jgi:hypothetical protein|tara:strand:- start:50 stop:184 length:135 start_codon:yes stop_codon:yes gene_type:complete